MLKDLNVKFNNDTSLYKGVFWIKELEDINSSILYYSIKCDANGNIIQADVPSSVLGKSGNNFNHNKLWDSLSKSITNNKSYDYFPRGRVEIKNGKSTIFISQYLTGFEDEVVKVIKKRFNLYSKNGVNKIVVCADGSNHYKPKSMV